MRIRRCAVLYFEPREDVAFDLNVLLSGGDGLRRERRWLALAPHRGVEVEVSQDERELLGSLSPGQWVDADALDVPSPPLPPQASQPAEPGTRMVVCLPANASYSVIVML